MTRSILSTVSPTRREPAGSPVISIVWVRITSTRSPGKISPALPDALSIGTEIARMPGSSTAARKPRAPGLTTLSARDRLANGERPTDDSPNQIGLDRCPRARGRCRGCRRRATPASAGSRAARTCRPPDPGRDQDRLALFRYRLCGHRRRTALALEPAANGVGRDTREQQGNQCTAPRDAFGDPILARPGTSGREARRRQTRRRPRREWWTDHDPTRASPHIGTAAPYPTRAGNPLPTSN